MSKHMLVVGLALTAAAIVATTRSHAAAPSVPAAPVLGSASSSTLNLTASLALTSRLGGCAIPPGVDNCAVRTLSGLFPGLGFVTATYDFFVDTTPPPCDAVQGKALAYPIRLAVASKGEITLAVAEGPCTDQESIRTQTQSFTVTGGNGIYAGASGSGSLSHVLGEDTGSGRSGKQTWTGTITVPGLEFDTTRPTLSGATGKLVKVKKGAKSARVAFKVTAQDDRDGAVRVNCFPRSGARFSLGRTRVSCSANDSSGNAATATFTVTVKRAR